MADVSASDDLEEALVRVCSPARLWRWDELAKHRPQPGLYSWWFAEIPPTVPIESTVDLRGLHLLRGHRTPETAPE